MKRSFVHAFSCASFLNDSLDSLDSWLLQLIAVNTVVVAGSGRA
jgi:hypothetical protein